MHSIARELSKHEDTTALRRSIFAYEFLNKLYTSDLPTAGCLGEAPLSIVEVIARWYAFDRIGAQEAAKSWWEGRETVRSLTEEMRRRRPKGFFGKTGGAYEREYAIAAESSIAEAIRPLAGSQVSVAEKSTKAPGGLSIDFIFANPDEPEKRIAVLIVGPYNNVKNYIAKSADWITRAYGLAWFYEMVVLAVPNVDALSAFDSRNATMRERIAEVCKGGDRKPQVMIVSLYVDPLAEEDHAALAALGP